MSQYTTPNRTVDAADGTSYAYPAREFAAEVNAFLTA
jgi:hypothetical protein